jgi:hypothetical protein
MTQDDDDRDQIGRLGEELAEHIRLGAERVDNPVRLDPRTSVIIAVHFNLEREIDEAMSRLVARPAKLNRLGYGQKVAVLQALVDGDTLDRAAQMLLVFNDLRNAAAHPNETKLEPLIKKLATFMDEDEIFPLDAEGEPPHDDAIECYGAVIAAALQVAVSVHLMMHRLIDGSD